MTTLDDFKEFVKDAESGTQYARWAFDNPGDLSKWTNYKNTVLSGGVAAEPIMLTPHGRELTDGVVLYLDSMPTPPVPVPTPPPPVPTPQPPTGKWEVAAPQGTMTKMDGKGTASTGLFERNTVGQDIHNLDVENYTDYGIGAMNWPTTPASSPYHIHDCIIRKVGRGMTSNGTAEAGLWAGFEGVYERMLIDAIDWSALWTGASCFNSRFSDFRFINSKHVPIYAEHLTIGCTFERIIIEQAEYSGNGFNGEWAYGGVSSHSNILRQMDIYVPKGKWGIFLDAGWYDNTISEIRLWGPGNGIRHPRNLFDPSKPNKIDLSTIDMSQLQGTKIEQHDNLIGA